MVTAERIFGTLRIQRFFRLRSYEFYRPKSSNVASYNYI